MSKLFPEFTLSTTLTEYTDHNRESWSSSGALQNRDVLLDILSDAMVIAPLTELADIQSKANETFFYVFTHRSSFSEYDVVNIFNNLLSKTDFPLIL